ncbi:MAG TPA: FG-GAP-like repeat-containing protein [Gemmataceae bacterium]|jgi:hypothetical protein
MNRRDFLAVAGAAGATAALGTPASGESGPPPRPPDWCGRPSLVPGDWPMWRHDGRLTGYQPLAGGMARPPRVVAKHFLGASPGIRTRADLVGAGRRQDWLVVARGRLAAFDHNGRPLWTSDTPGYDIAQVCWVDDLDGDRANEVVVRAGHVGGTRLAYVILDAKTGKARAAIDFLSGDFGFTGLCGAYVPGRAGKQIFLVTSARQGAGVAPAQTGEFSLWALDGGQAKRLWSHVPSEFQVLYPAVMVAELAPKEPGKVFGVVNSWCHVWSFELATGRVVSHETWDSHSASARHYGWNELVDVDGDGAPDFVNVSLTKHVDVLRNDGTGRLRLAWSHGWDDVITTEKRALRPISNGVVDVDGDGKAEVIAGLFDGLGDGRWHLFVWDAVTGALKAEGHDLAPLATVALWGPGRPRAILCARSTTVQFDPPPALEAWALREGKLQQIWTAPAGTRLKVTVPSSTDRRAIEFNSIKVGDPVTAVDGDGRESFVTADVATGAERAWGLSPAGEVVEKPLPPPAADPAGPALPDLEGKTVAYLLAADVDGDGRNELLLYDDARLTICKLQSGALRPVRTVDSTEVPIVCDLLGDGRPALLTAGRTNPGRDLHVRADGPDGKELWTFVFPQTAACGQYSERPHYFAVGRFTGGKHLDVFAFSMKPEARAYVLDGRTGRAVYRRDEVKGIDRSFQAFGGRTAVWDYDGDGADDILFTNPDYYCVADGRTGDLLVGPVQLQALTGRWPAYASPAVLRPADPAARPFIYLGGAYACRCAIAADGKASLFAEPQPTERWPLAVGPQRFTEGLLPPSRANPHWRVATVEADGTLRLIRADTGQYLWAHPLGTAAGVMVSGDVDGDGEPELLIGGRDGRLHCIGDGGSGPRTLWTLPFAAPVASVVLADVDGDGRSEIVASVGDGFVYVLGPRL